MQIYLLTSPAKFHTGLHLLSLICRNARPVRRDFGHLAFPQGEELIPHIDALCRILLSAPGGNQTASIPSRMMPFGCPLDGFLLFLLYSFSIASCSVRNCGRPPCLVRLWLIGGMSFISCYAFASKLFCGFSTPTASSPASGMPLLAFPHASLYIMHISVCLAASALVVYIVHPLLE